MNTTTKTTYEIHKLTGSTLVDASGRGYGNESAGCVAKARSLESAERKLSDFQDTCPLNSYEIREVQK